MKRHTLLAAALCAALSGCDRVIEGEWALTRVEDAEGGVWDYPWRHEVDGIEYERSSYLVIEYTGQGAVLRIVSDLDRTGIVDLSLERTRHQAWHLEQVDGDWAADCELGDLHEKIDNQIIRDLWCDTADGTTEYYVESFDAGG